MVVFDLCRLISYLLTGFIFMFIGSRIGMLLERDTNNPDMFTEKDKEKVGKVIISTIAGIILMSIAYTVAYSESEVTVFSILVALGLVVGFIILLNKVGVWLEELTESLDTRED